MTLTQIRHLLTATALTAAAGLAQAGPMTLGQSQFDLTSTGPFSLSTSLSLSERQLVSLDVLGWSANAADLQFDSVLLQKGNQSFLFDRQAQHNSLGAALLAQEQRGNGRGRWIAHLQTFDLSPVVLDAGDWTITVSGTDEHLKFYSGFGLRVETAAVVSEPASLALVSMALMGGLLVRRRKAQAA